MDRVTHPPIRKGLSIALVSTLVSILAACGGGSGSSLVKEVQTDKKMTFGLAENAPDVYRTEDGKWTGTFVVVAEKLAKSFGAEPVFTSTSWQNIVAGVQSNKFQLAVDLTYTEERAESVDFTIPVYEATGALLLNPSKTDAKTWEEATAAGNSICVAKGSTPDIAISELALPAKILRLENKSACYLALTSGKTDSSFEISYSGAEFASRNPGYKLLYPPHPVDEGTLSFAIAKGWPESDLKTINKHLKQLLKDGTWDKTLRQFNVASPAKYAVPPVPDYVEEAGTYQ